MYNLYIFLIQLLPWLLAIIVFLIIDRRKRLKQRIRYIVKGMSVLIILVGLYSFLPNRIRINDATFSYAGRDYHFSREDNPKMISVLEWEVYKQRMAKKFHISSVGYKDITQATFRTDDSKVIINDFNLEQMIEKLE